MLVVLGCIIAGVGDLAFDLWAYSYAFCSVITQSIYLLLVEEQVRLRRAMYCINRAWHAGRKPMYAESDPLFGLFAIVCMYLSMCQTITWPVNGLALLIVLSTWHCSNSHTDVITSDLMRTIHACNIQDSALICCEVAAVPLLMLSAAQGACRRKIFGTRDLLTCCSSQSSALFAVSGGTKR